MYEPLPEPYRAPTLFPQKSLRRRATAIVRACVRSRPCSLPSPAGWSTPARATRLPAEQTDLALRVDGVTLRGWEVNPGRERALVHYGGNGEGLDWLVPEHAHRFPDHTSYLVAYRGYGASEGTPSERVLTTDALAVFDHAAARHPGGVDVVGPQPGQRRGDAGRRTTTARAARCWSRRSTACVATAADLYPWLPVDHLLQDRWDSLVGRRPAPGARARRPRRT